MAKASFNVLPMLARRFLLSRSADGFVSLITWVSIAGVSIGVMALVTVTSVINGFEGELARVITGMHADVLLYSRAEAVKDPELVELQIRRAVPEALGIAPVLAGEIMVSGADGVAGAIIEGQDFAVTGKVTELASRVQDGTLPGPGAAGVHEIALGSALAERIGAKVGDEIRVIVPYTEASSDGAELGAPKSIAVKVSGIVKMGMNDFDSKYVYAPLGWVQEFFGMQGRVTGFKIKLREGVSSSLVSDRLKELFSYPFRAKNWKELNANLFYAIQLEKAVISIFVMAIIVVAAFNVVSTLMMMIHDKTKEIAILKAMGLRPMQGFWLFVSLGGAMGVVGAALGFALGMGGNSVIENFRIVDLPADIYNIAFLPVRVRWSEVLLIVGGAALLALLAALYPAWKVSTKPPLEGIRYD